MNIQPISTKNLSVQPLPSESIVLQDGFWSSRQRLVREQSIPHAMEMFRTYGYFENLKTAAGLDGKGYHGRNFLDTDLYKWIEAAAYSLASIPDPVLESEIEGLVNLIAQVQMEDGYLNSYYRSMEPQNRWTNLDHGHELYTAGHLFEAAVAMHRATGNEQLLGIATRFADLIYTFFMEQKNIGAPGHPEIEHALVELYRETGNEKYLALSLHFLDERGKRRMAGYDGIGPEYHQDHLPVREVDSAVGHVVRQLYLASGMMDAYIESGDHALLEASERLWEDVHFHKTYLTGAFGSRFQGESFGESYELPSDLCYCETCASVANMMWNWRLLVATGKAKYAQGIEQTLYNGFLSGLGLDGTHFFYVNPLQTHSGVERQSWFEVSCCPPNIMRQIMGVGQYLATKSTEGIQVHQYFAADIHCTIDEIQDIQIHIETKFPWDGEVTFDFSGKTASVFDLALRIPPWAETVQLWVNGMLMAVDVDEAYVHLKRLWQAGDVVRLNLGMTAQFIYPHPRIDALRNSVAIQRGPLVYCLEGCDCDEDASLLDIAVDPKSALHLVWDDKLGGMMTVTAEGIKRIYEAPVLDLYLSNEPTVQTEPICLKAIPYYAWANRGKHAMRVWIPKKE